MVKALIFLAACLLLSGAIRAQETAGQKLVGMYIHQGWSYNHPYAARTWTLENWQQYLGGISALGYNSILIWPMLETMPNPMTPSDSAHVDRMRAVIDLAHRKFKMKTFVVLCANIGPKSELASTYSYEDRPLYGIDEYIDPADPVKLGKLMAWREELLKPLKAADGIFIIDSDPGGYPNSTNPEFAYLLTAHRRMLDRLRPGIEIYYWAWTGWESYGRFHATGHFSMGTQEEIQDALSLIEKQRPEPWGVATHWLGYGAQVDAEMKDRVLAYNYGAIEADPAFPFTLFGPAAYEGGMNTGSRGVFGNALTHCVQLPNTFAFARGALGLTAERGDYIAFANQLIEGAGESIVEGWEALQGTDAVCMKAAAMKLINLSKSDLKTGKFRGLLFGDPKRFVDDLISQLQMAAALFTLKRTLGDGEGMVTKTSVAAFSAFITAVEDWHDRHGYNSYWFWPPMTETLTWLPTDRLKPFLEGGPWWEDGVGDTPGERIGDAYKKIQTYTPRLIAAMKSALDDLRMQGQGNK